MRSIGLFATVFAAAAALLPVLAVPTGPTDIDLGYVLFKGQPDESAVTELSSPTGKLSGSLELFAHVAIDNWTSTSHQTIIGSSKAVIQLIAATNGSLRLVLKLKGKIVKVTSVRHSFANGRRKWIRAKFDARTGIASFFYSDSLATQASGITDWSPLGNPIRTTEVGSIKSTTSVVLGRRREADGKFTLAGALMYGINIVHDGSILAEVDFTKESGWSSEWMLNGLEYIAPKTGLSPSLLPTPVPSPTPSALQPTPAPTPTPSLQPTPDPLQEPTRMPVPGADKKNLVVILTDQQKYDAIQMVQEERGTPASARIHTPNLDRIAREGAYFRNAYTHCAVCGPARASLMTGSTIENTGIRTNRLSQDENLPGSDAEYKLPNLLTYDDILVRDHSYVAEYYGKWHTPNFMGHIFSNDVRRGGGSKAWFGKYNDDGTKHYSWGMTEWYRMWLKENPNATTAAIPTDDGDQINSFSKYFYDPDPLDLLYGLETGADVEVRQPDRHGMNRLVDGLSITAQQASETLDALDRLANGDKPFSLHLSLHSPHAPMIPTKKYYDMYNPDDMAVPASLKDDMVNSAYAALGAQRLEGYDDPAKVQRWTANYFGLITEVDEWMGKILDKLDELGITENTLLAFSADHGEMMGGHGMREKNNFYEESAHVPLLLRMPGTIPAGTVVDDPVSHLDLHSTFLDYVVGGTNYSTDGSSLRGPIEGTKVEDPFVVTMWNWTDITNGYRPSRDPAFMIRKGNWKLMLSCQAGYRNVDMLYNLDNDPSEVNNLIGKNGNTASAEIIGKAEHLKAVLVKSLKESNHPAVEDIQRRRTWRATSFWLGDSSMSFRDTLADGTRTEFLYLGTPSGRTVSLSVDGEHASRYQLKLDSQYALEGLGFSVIAVKYSGTSVSAQDSAIATLSVRLDTGEERSVALMPPPSVQLTTNITAEDNSLFESSIAFVFDPNDVPTSSPTSSPTNEPTRTMMPTLFPTPFEPCTGPIELGPAAKLYSEKEQHFICSSNGYYKFGMASDGDLSLWHGATKVWSANTCCTGSGAYVTMQRRDGNLVVYSYLEEDIEDEKAAALWSSKTTGNANAVLTMDDDGNARIRSADDSSKVIWETNIFS